jgi:hypothetical protein
MYKIIGADQKEYGPISAEQIRLWIQEGRLNATSKIQVDGSESWPFLKSNKIPIKAAADWPSLESFWEASPFCWRSSRF